MSRLGLLERMERLARFVAVRAGEGRAHGAAAKPMTLTVECEGVVVTVEGIPSESPPAGARATRSPRGGICPHDVLRAFSSTAMPTVRQVARTLKCNKYQAHEAIKWCAEGGFLEQEATGRYQISSQGLGLLAEASLRGGLQRANLAEGAA